MRPPEAQSSPDLRVPRALAGEMLQALNRNAGGRGLEDGGAERIEEVAIGFGKRRAKLSRSAVVPA